MRAPQASGAVPAPIDVRLVPAAGLALLCAAVVPALPYDSARLLPPSLVATGALLTVLLVLVARTGRRGPVGVLGMLCLACWVGAVVGLQALGERAEVRATGWEQTVAGQGPARLSGTVLSPPSAQEGRFGTRWQLRAEVQSFGHPLRSAPPATEVQVSADDSWKEVLIGQELCFTAELEAEGATVFATAKTAPGAGDCGDAPGTEEADSDSGTREHTVPVPTGRDRLRQDLVTASSAAPGRAPELLPGLVLGDRSAQSEELDEAMKDAGLSHLSAVSGANCTLLAGAVTLLLRSLRVHRVVVLTAVLGTLLLFVVVVGVEPSVIRAAVMGGLGALALFWGRGRQAVPLLCLAVCVLLAWTPALALEPAFQLSVCATSGIILGARPMEQWLTGVLGNWLPGPVAGIISAALAVTVCAQIACQPLLVGLSGSVSLYAVPANLAAAPLVPFITVPGTLAAALLPLLPQVSTALLWCVGWPAAGIGWIAQTVAGWPEALRPWPAGVVGVVLLVLHGAGSAAALWLLMRWEQTRPARVRRLPQPRRRLVPARERRAVAVAWMLVVVGVGSQLPVLIPPLRGSVPADWSMAACDVGQGDMLVLRSGEQSAVVVDTGEDPAATQRCLQDLGVHQVDALMLSHLHADHAGALPAVLELGPGRVIYSSSPKAGSGGEDGGSVSAPPGAQQARAGDTGQVGAEGWGMDWTVLAADDRALTENDASLVLTARVRTPEGSYSVLLTGDLEQDAARRMLGAPGVPEQVDVLKVSHHGARNGGLDTAQALHPRLSLISVGADNTYGHPHPVIARELARYGPVVRTDLLGTAVLSLREGSLVTTGLGP